MVAQVAVNIAVERHQGGDVHDEVALRSQELAEATQLGNVIADVLEHVDEHGRVVVVARQMLVGWNDAHMWVLAESGPENRQRLTGELGGGDLTDSRKPLGHAPPAGSHLEDLLPQLRFRKPAT